MPAKADFGFTINSSVRCTRPSPLRCACARGRVAEPAMLAPYPDRLRSSRSTSAQPNAASRSTPPTTTSSSSQHRLFASRSSIPLTRSRTNSLSSPSPVSNHSDSPSTSPDFILPTSLRNATRRPHLLPRPSTSSGVPDQKHTTSGPATVTSPFSGSVSVPVSPLSAHHLSSLAHYL